MSDPGFRSSSSRIVAALLSSVYVGALVSLLLLASGAADGSRSPALRSLLLAEAGALARIQAALRPHSAALAGAMDESIGAVFDLLGDGPAPEMLIWLGETAQIQRLKAELQREAEADPRLAGLHSAALLSLYEGPVDQASVSASRGLQSLISESSGFFRQRLVQRTLGLPPGDGPGSPEGEAPLYVALGLGAAVLALGLCGLGVLASAWLWLETLHPSRRFPPPDPGRFPGLDVYLAFLAWMALYLTLSLAVGLLGIPARFAVTSMLVVYLVQALCGWLLLWRLLAPDLSGTELLRRIVQGAGRPGPGRCLAFWLGGYAVALPVVYGSWLATEALLGDPPISDNPLIPMLFESGSAVDRLEMLVFVAVLAPLFEELLFRGIVLPSLRHRLGAAPAILLSGLLFGAIHLDPSALLPLTCLGCVLGYVAHRSGSLVPAILLHALWNAQSFVQLELLRRLA